MPCSKFRSKQDFKCYKSQSVKECVGPQKLTPHEYKDPRIFFGCLLQHENLTHEIKYTYGMRIAV